MTKRKKEYPIRGSARSAYLQQLPTGHLQITRNKSGNPSRVYFLRGGGRNNRPIVFIPSDVFIEPGFWNARDKVIMSTYPEADKLNAKLTAFHAFIMEGIKEGHSQDEIRRLMEIDKTRFVTPHYKNRTSSVTEIPSTDFQEEEQTRPSEVNSSLTNSTSFDMATENQLASADNGLDIDSPPTETDYIVQEKTFSDSALAVNYAFIRAMETGQPVIIRQVTIASIAVINPITK